MYVEDIIKKLQANSIRVGRTDYYSADAVDDLLRKHGRQCIRWMTDDFIHMAVQNSTVDEWKQYYNEERFEAALEEMISYHDAEYGITWDTVDHYLNTYCKIKDYVAPYKSHSKLKHVTTKDLQEIDKANEERK